jgi:hypothetical protein
MEREALWKGKVDDGQNTVESEQVSAKVERRGQES